MDIREVVEIKRAISKLKKIKRETKRDPNKKRIYKDAKYKLRALRERLENAGTEL